MRCVTISCADTAGQCKVEIPATHYCMGDVVDIGDGVPDSSDEREKISGKATRALHVRFAFVCERLLW